jgi:hypothetical protein
MEHNKKVAVLRLIVPGAIAVGMLIGGFGCSSDQNKAGGVQAFTTANGTTIDPNTKPGKAALEQMYLKAASERPHR